MAIELLRRIPPHGRRITASDLHQQLAGIGIERNVRTIQRMLGSLSLHFGIVRYECGRQYEYAWPEGARGINLPTMSSQESLVFDMARQHLRNILPEQLVSSMTMFFNQADKNLRSEEIQASRARVWKQKVKVISTSQPLRAPAIPPSIFEAVSNALYQNHFLTIEYRNAEDKETGGLIMPLGLVVQGPRQYLVCRFDGHDDERILAMHRLISAKMTTLNFIYPTDFDLGKFTHHGRFNYGQGKRVQISFHIDYYPGRNLIETPLSADQVNTRLKNGRYKITATVMDSLLLEQFLNSYGDEISHVVKKAVDAHCSSQ